ncbi:MAG: tetratricopeptide repeat protein, partial [Nitrospira sp.]|nr:tetratricopeptide repeat protein [Nitrospira sp.]
YQIKLDSKEIPVDEAHLLSRMERFILHVQEHRRQVLIGAVAVLAVIAAVLAVVWYDHRQAEQALELHHRATTLYIDRPLDNVAKADENLKQAIVLYRQAAEQYPRSPTAPLSLYYLGNALVQANDLPGAIAIYKKYAMTYGANKILLGMVYQRLGYAHLLNGDREQAVKAFSSVLDVPGAFNKDQMLFELGKLEEVQSRPEGALARYQDLNKNYPNSPLTSEAAVRIKALEVKKTPESGASTTMPPAPAEPAK